MLIACVSWFSRILCVTRSKVEIVQLCILRVKMALAPSHSWIVCQTSSFSSLHWSCSSSSNQSSSSSLPAKMKYKLYRHIHWINHHLLCHLSHLASSSSGAPELRNVNFPSDIFTQIYLPYLWHFATLGCTLHCTFSASLKIFLRRSALVPSAMYSQ